MSRRIGLRLVPALVLASALSILVLPTAGGQEVTSLSPTSGPVGTPITISGMGSSYDFEAVAFWGGSCGGYEIARGVVDDSYLFSITGTVPTAGQVSYGMAFPGSHEITVCEWYSESFYPFATLAFELTNSPPVAQDDSGTVRLGETVELVVTSNDSDPNVSSLLFCAASYLHTFNQTSSAVLGDVAIDNQCEVIRLIYQAGRQPGIETFTYRITDPEGEFADATVTIDVGCRQTPVSVNDTAFELTTGGSVSIDPYATASHPCGLGKVRDGLAVERLSEPQHGTLSEGYVYTPSDNYVGPDQFQFRLCHYDERERQQCSNTATITITVTTQPPTAEANGPYEGDLGTAVSFNSDGSADSDGSIRSAWWDFGDGTTSTSAHPSHIYSTGGTFTAVLTVEDNHGAVGTDDALVYIHSPPAAGDVRVAVAAGDEIMIDLSAAVSDPDDDVDIGSISLITSGLSGSVQLTGDMARFVAANVEKSTTTSFTYDVADERGNRSNRGRVAISIRAEVAPPGEPPTANNDAAESDGSPVTIEVLGNDAVPIDLETLEVTLLDDGPTNGVAEVVGTTVVYRPGPGFAGIETFEYQVCSEDGCSVGTITVDVELLCDLTTATIGTFELESPLETPGDLSTLIVNLRVAQLDSTCGGFELPITFDDMPLGSVILELDGPLSSPPSDGLFVLVAFRQQEERRVIANAVLSGRVDITLPENVAEGPHIIRLWAGEPLETIAEMSFEVPAAATTTTTTSAPEVPAEVQDDKGLPIGVVATGGLTVLAAAGAGGLLLARKRLYAEPCVGPRKSLLSAEQAAEKARSEADAAEASAEEAEAKAAEAEAALAACMGESKRTGLLPIGLALPGSGGDASVPVTDGFYLEEHPNPYATDRDELPGWFGLQRTETVRGVVIHTGGVVPATVTTAAEAAQELATVRRPFSLHAIVDDAGVVVLLRDERVGRHLPSADQDSLGVLWLPGEDENRSLAVLGAWCAAKASAHGFAMRQVGFEEWVQGDSGLIGAGDFPEAAGAQHRLLAWDDLLAAAQPAKNVPLAMPISSLRRGDRCFEEQQTRDQAQAVAREARTNAVEAQATANQSEAEAEAAKQQLEDCECRHPVIATPVNAATQSQPDESDPSRWFLLKHENKNGGQRANGRHGWYYPNRQQPITGIVVHTAEAGSGPGVAAYLSKVSRPASAHVVIDSAGPVDLLPDSAVAFHAKGGNSRGLGLEIAYTASKWGKKPDKEERLYRNSAAWCALKALQYGIPVRRVSVDQWLEGVPGFISHAELDPARRTDPGANFDWDHFFELIREYMAGGGLPGGSSAASAVTDL